MELGGGNKSTFDSENSLGLLQDGQKCEKYPAFQQIAVPQAPFLKTARTINAFRPGF
jgi:hypothetical protein